LPGTFTIPNVAGATVLSLGCQKRAAVDPDGTRFAKGIRALRKPVLMF